MLPVQQQDVDDICNDKKKKVVYDFINHVGLEWMDSVEAVACDMNSDLQETFEELCPHMRECFRTPAGNQ